MENFKQNLSSGLRRFAMAGVGAITLTVDKSREIIDQLASRGEVSAAEGQAACDELQKKLTEQVSSFTRKLRADYENLSFEQMLSRCQKLTPEQKQQLIDRLTAQPGETARDEASADPRSESEENEMSEGSTKQTVQTEDSPAESACTPDSRPAEPNPTGSGADSAVQTESTVPAEASSSDSFIPAQDEEP